jgi:hypothetical protein
MIIARRAANLEWMVSSTGETVFENKNEAGNERLVWADASAAMTNQLRGFELPTNRVYKFWNHA